MLLAALNFATHFLAWRERSLAAYWRDAEVARRARPGDRELSRLQPLSLAGGIYPEFLTALRHVSFNLVSIATDCGFASTDLTQWPIFVPLWMLFLSCITASSGSTGGGIKMIRTLMLVRQSVRELTRSCIPRAPARSRSAARCPTRSSFADPRLHLDVYHDASWR